MPSLTTRTRPGRHRSAAAPAHWSARALLVAALVFAGAWFSWRIVTVGWHPLRVIVLLIELSGWTGGVLVARGLLAARAPRGAIRDDGTYRYAFAVADRVGRTRASDLRSDLRSATERLLERRPSSRADRAMVGVAIDGPRRVALVSALVVCLLVGVAPMDVPPLWAISAATAGTATLAMSHRVASGGRIRLGDRTRWSFVTLGEVLGASDRDDVAPRRWVGTVATIVALNICIALRGISDRWTHGLPEMSDDGRLVAMVWGLVVVVAGLYTLRTTQAPQLGNAHLVARRLEERAARRSAIGAAVCLGMVGLVAGVVPVEAASDLDRPSETIDDAELVERNGTAGG